MQDCKERFLRLRGGSLGYSLDYSLDYVNDLLCCFARETYDTVQINTPQKPTINIWQMSTNVTEQYCSV